MSVVYCEICEEYIDTDFKAEHFDEEHQATLEFDDGPGDFSGSNFNEVDGR